MKKYLFRIVAVIFLSLLTYIGLGLISESKVCGNYQNNIYNNEFLNLSFDFGDGWQDMRGLNQVIGIKEHDLFARNKDFNDITISVTNLFETKPLYLLLNSKALAKIYKKNANLEFLIDEIEPSYTINGNKYQSIPYRTEDDDIVVLLYHKRYQWLHVISITADDTEAIENTLALFKPYTNE